MTNENKSDALDRLAYVQRVMEGTRWTAGKLADVAGVARTTISRAIKDPENFGGFHDGTIRKIAAASGIPAPEGMLPKEPASGGSGKDLNEDDLVACMELVEEWLEAQQKKASAVTKSRVIAVGLWPSIPGIREQNPQADIDQLKEALREKVDVAMRMAGVQ